jgi:hypothetical protein
MARMRPCELLRHVPAVIDAAELAPPRLCEFLVIRFAWRIEIRDALERGEDRRARKLARRQATKDDRLPHRPCLLLSHMRTGRMSPAAVHDGEIAMPPRLCEFPVIRFAWRCRQ